MPRKTLCGILTCCFFILLVSSIAIADSIDLFVTMDITPNMGGWPTLSYDLPQTQITGDAPGENINIFNNPNNNYTIYNAGTWLSLMETGISTLNESKIRIYAHLTGTASGGNSTLTQSATTNAYLSLSYTGDFPGQAPGGFYYDMNGSYSYTIKIIDDAGPSFENTNWQFNFNSQTIRLNLPANTPEYSGGGNIGIQFIGGYDYDPMFGSGSGGGSGWVHFDIEQSGVSSVPLPGAVWLLGSGLLGLIGFRRKFKT